MIMIIILIIVFIGLIFINALKWLNNSLLFAPIKLLKNYTIDDIKKIYGKTLVCNIEEYYVVSKSNKIHSLYFKNPQSNKLIIYCHGNSGNIIEYNHEISTMYKFGSVILFDYSGYGKSTGTPSENQLYNDVLSIWKYSINKLNYKPNEIILWGMSLGCSVALWLCQYIVKKYRDHYHPKLVIIQSGFYSLSKISSEMNKLAPYFLIYNFDNNEYIKNINEKIPILIFHSKNDEMINCSHSLNLSKNKKCYFEYIEGGHNTNIHTKQSLKLIKKYTK